MKKPGKTRLFGDNQRLNAAGQALQQEPEPASREQVLLAWSPVLQALPRGLGLPGLQALVRKPELPARRASPLRVPAERVLPGPGRAPASAAACSRPWPWPAGQ
jgi:hypothetical protein